MSEIYALEIDNVTKVYSSGTHALDGISLKIKHGDFYALLGHNGAGKSTLIGIISSIVRKTSGTVKIFGYDLDKDPNKAKPHIGIVNQEFNMNIHDKVKDLLVYSAGYFGIPRKEAISKADYWLDILSLGDKANNKISSLSGGMKRRVMIARALMHNPKLLILDEPTAGVDISLRRDMWDFLVRINKAGTTIILTTHYLEEAEYLCRNIGIINKGKLIVNSSIKDLLETLDSETFILDVVGDTNQEIKADGFEFNKISEDQIEIVVRKNLNQSINHAFAVLSKFNIEVKSMKNESSRLESVFIKYE